VDWRQQPLREGGDLVMADPAALRRDKIVDLFDLLAGREAGRSNGTEITVYKSVGVGLQDVALAGLAWQRITAAEGLA